MTRQPLAPEIDAAIREKAANIATLRFGPIHLLREGIERTSAESYRSALVEHMREIAALAVAHTQQAEREALTTQVEQWRRDAARHKTHSDCYHVGQGWGLEQCADELTALLLPAPDGSQEG